MWRGTRRRWRRDVAVGLHAYQKNPILSAFFREIDRADELGSGMRKMMLYGKKYGGADPQLIEGDNFRMIISVPEFGANPAMVGFRA